MMDRTPGASVAARRWGMLAVAVLLVLAMLDPPLPLGEPAAALTLVMDDSASHGSGGADGAWQALLPLLRRLPSGSTLTLIRFGVEPVVELVERPTTARLDQGVPRSVPVSGRGSDLAAALDLIPAGSAALLVSDGLATASGVDLALARVDARRIPISWWQRPDTLPEAWLSSIDTPARMPADAPLPVMVTLDAAKDADVLLSLDLDGRPVLRRRVQLRAAEPSVLDLEVPPPTAGVHRVTARLSRHQDGGNADVIGDSPAARASVLVRVEGARTVLLVGDETRDLATALAAGGWEVVSRRPDALRGNDLDRSAIIVLDDVPVSALGPQLWRRLSRAVTGRGSGLLVLGGGNSFAAGGYRHSALERLLPLLSEPPRRLPSAVVLFALDTSGSMAQPAATGLTRLELARIAAADAATVLGPRDKVGLALFGADAVLALPVIDRPHQGRAITTATAEAPGGGTRLAPLVRLALEQLAAAATPANTADDTPPKAPEDVPGTTPRLLVVLSDGQFADAADAAPGELGKRLAAAGIQVMAIGIGDPARADALRLLAESSGGRFHQVPPGEMLPGFVAEQVQMQRIEPRRTRVPSLAADRLPFSPSMRISGWPAVAGYQPTRLRKGAKALVVTADGDPLVAWQRAGLGRVVAFAAGLNGFAPEWRAWDRLPVLLGSMLAWLAGDDTDPQLWLVPDETLGSIRLAVDAMDADGAWSSAQRLHWRLDLHEQRPGESPASPTQQGSVEATAPGRFELELSAPDTGRYDLEVSVAGREQRQALWHEPRLEWLPSGVARESLDALQQLPRWTPESGWPPPGWPAQRHGASRLLVAAALLLFVGLVLGERLRLEDLPSFLDLPRLWSVGNRILHGRRGS